MANSRDPLRVLCIHGFRQNATTFREKLGAFRKLMKNHIEFEFVDGPLHVPDRINPEIEERAWWFSRENRQFDASDNTTICMGFVDSVKTVEKACKEMGPFDGILGFSQGASLVGLICVLLQRKEFSEPFKFAVMIAGFRSLAELHDVFYTEMINIPTLHVYGENDAVIPKEKSEYHAAHFRNPCAIIHEGGHYVPATTKLRAAYVKFFDDFKCM